MKPLTQETEAKRIKAVDIQLFSLEVNVNPESVVKQ